MGEQEFADINEKLRMENAQLKEALALRTKVLSLVGHDIKNAVNGLLGMLGLLEADKVGGQEKAQALSFAKESSQRMEEIVENYLLWSKAENPDFPLHSEGVLFQDALLDVMDVYQDRIQSKKITIYRDIPDSLWILGDNIALRAILRSCLSNCLKFSSAGSSVEILSSFPGAKQVRIHFINHGAPFDVQELQELMEGAYPKYRNAGTAGEKGSGIGIRLASKFLERMGSKLDIQSREDQTEFAFTLPRIDED